MNAEMDGIKEKKIDGEIEHDMIFLPDQRTDLVRQESPKRLHHHQ